MTTDTVPEGKDSSDAEDLCFQREIREDIWEKQSSYIQRLWRRILSSDGSDVDQEISWE